SFYEKLMELYVEFGLYREELISLVKKGIDGEMQIKQMMVDLRDQPLKEIAGEKIVLIEDYQSSIARNLQDHTEHTIDIPKSNVLIYYTEEGTKVAARPSGTEPKIKFYISVSKDLETVDRYEIVSEELSEKISRIKGDLQVD
ncbi:MAG TPA: hypothetical protein VK941_00260, partial [Gillisia sp.]|nr:hypothetical protein [Gillisia sp.]